MVSGVGWALFAAALVHEWPSVAGPFVRQPAPQRVATEKERLPAGAFGDALRPDQRWAWTAQGSDVGSFGGGTRGECGLLVRGEMQPLPGCTQLLGPAVLEVGGAELVVFERGDEVVVRRLRDGREQAMARPRERAVLAPFLDATEHHGRLRVRYGHHVAVLDADLTLWPGGWPQRLEARGTSALGALLLGAFAVLALLLCWRAGGGARRLRRAVREGRVIERVVGLQWVTEWMARSPTMGDGAYREGGSTYVERADPGRVADVRLRLLERQAAVVLATGLVMAALVRFGVG